MVLDLLLELLFRFSLLAAMNCSVLFGSVFWLLVELQIKPGLSAYANDPQLAANSLTSLLDKAQSVVPQELRSKTPVRVGVSGYKFFLYFIYQDFFV